MNDLVGDSPRRLIVSVSKQWSSTGKMLPARGGNNRTEGTSDATDEQETTIFLNFECGTGDFHGEKLARVIGFLAVSLPHRTCEVDALAVEHSGKYKARR